MVNWLFSRPNLRLALNIFKILSPQSKRQIKRIIPVYAFLAILDLIGVVLLASCGTIAYNFVSGDTRPSRIEVILRQVFPVQIESSTLIFVFALAAASFLMTKTILSAFVNYRMVKWLANQESIFSSSLFSSLLQAPMSEIRKIGVGDAQWALMMGSSRIVSGVVAPLVTVLGDLISIIVLLVTLIFASPEVTFILVIILAMSQRIYSIWFRGRLISYGQQASDKGAALNEEIIQSFQAVKEIKIYSLTEAINQYFTRERGLISLIGQKSSFLNNLFRYYLETIILFSAFFVVTFELSTSDLRRALTSLVLFMSVGLRIIPSLQRVQAITMSLQQSQGMTKTYFDMKEQLQNLDQEDIVSEDLIQHPAQVLGIEFKDLTYSVENYGVEQVILQEINFKINPGAFVCIIGESGSGKTTLVDLISGLLGARQGKISYFDLSGGTFNTNRSYVGYCSQNPYIFDTSIEKNLIIAKKHIDNGKINSLINELNLRSLHESTQEANNVALSRRISGGERQRIGIARAFLSERPILVFDEPTSALDKENALRFFEILNRNRQKRTQIVVTHDLELAKKSDLLIILDQGRLIYSGKSEDYFENKK